jgi:hypothetical protein
MGKIVIIFSFLILSIPALAQELNFNVKVNAGPIQNLDNRLVKDMEVAFAQFLNQRKWTNDEFKVEEKINANLIITLESQASIGDFKATVQVQSARPVFNTNYETLLLNFADRDWHFNYTISQPLDFTENSFMNNITSLLAFYAYIVIGIDYDSFSELGGSSYFEKAMNVVNYAQQSERPGWKQLEGNRNRYWLVENLLNQQLEPIRKGYYAYHRLALDEFAEKDEEARKIILDVLKEIRKAATSRPNSILTISFFDAKRDEIINIFSKGDPSVRKEAYEVLTRIDPTKSGRYANILKN